MRIVRCPNRGTRLLAVGEGFGPKYLLPTNLRRGAGTKPPTELIFLDEPDDSLPASVDMLECGEDPWLGAYRYPQFANGRTEIADLPAQLPRRTYVARLSEGTSVGRQCTAITAEGQMVAESGFFIGPHRPVPRFRSPLKRWKQWRSHFQSHLHLRKRLPTTTRFDGTVAVLNLRCCNNYYHWLLDILARLAALKAADVSPDLYLVECTSPFQVRALEQFGIPQESILQPHCGLSLQASELLLPCFPTPNCLRMFRGMIDESFGNVSSLPMRSPRSIYISRRNAATRKFANEAEVDELLNRRGFETICLEDHPLERQFQLIAGADTIVTTHGAGLANTVAARPGTRIIEIVHSDRYNADLFPRLSRTMGLVHSQVLCERAKHRQILRPDVADLELALDDRSKPVRLAA